jgi:hypothetical protein
MTAAKGANPNQKATAVGILTGTVVYFVTPEYKYGALLFNSTDVDATGVFWNVSIKIQQQESL